MPSVSSTAHGALPFWPSEVVVSRIAPAFRVQATEKSIPPTRITKVCPAATNPMKEAITRIVWMLLRLMKPSRSSPPTASTSSAAPNA
jgi:hypothetical protein